MRPYIFMIAALAACAETDTPTATAVDDLTNTPCATSLADEGFTVPETFTNKTFPSASGAYGYVRFNALSQCQGFIFDIYMTTTSNLNPDPKTHVPSNPDGKLVMDAEAYDLPGSATQNGTTPTTKNDCNRYSGALYVYTWPHTDTGYTYVGGALYGGTWANGACTIAQTTTPFKIPYAYASSSGVDRYRLVYGVIERTTYQEAAIRLSQPQPE